MAEHTPTMQPRPSGVSRRTIVKGAAWAVPVTAVVGAAPAFAASRGRPGELVGTVLYTKTCSPDNAAIPGRLQIDGTLPGAELYVTATSGVGTPPVVVVTIFLNHPDWTFTQIDLDGQNESNGWSNLVRAPGSDVPARTQAPYAYRTTYSTAATAWTYVAASTRWVPNGRPYFRSEYGLGCVDITTYVDRSVTLNGQTIVTSRGPASV